MTARDGVPLVVDANVVISALIADAETRQCPVLLDEDSVTPALIHDETTVIETKSSRNPTAPPTESIVF